VQTGAALMPAILWFEGDGRGVHIHEEIPREARRVDLSGLTAGRILSGP
jgi:hypothetical protein